MLRWESLAGGMGLGVEIKSAFWPSQECGMPIRLPGGDVTISSRSVSVKFRARDGLDINV